MAVPEKLRFQIKYPEISIGDEAFKRTIQFAQRAIADVYPAQKYPVMAQRPGRDIPLDRIQIRPLDEMRQLQQTHKPSDEILLYRAVILAGLPEEEVKSRVYPTFGDYRYYLDPTSLDGPHLYMAKEAVDPLFSNEPVDRTRAAIRLGFEYIVASLEALMEPQMVAPNLNPLVRTLARDTLAELLEEIAKSPSVNREVLPQVQDMIGGLLDDDREAQRVRFIASGAKFMVLLPGQTLLTAEFGTGFNFDVGVQLFLTLPVTQRFVALMEANYMTGNMKHPILAEDRLRAQTIQSMLGVLGFKERDRALDAYLNSDLPFHIIASDNPKVDIRPYTR